MFTETSYVCVLTAKFGLSSMVLTNFRQEGGNFIPLPPPKPPQGEVLGSGPGLGLVGLRASAYSFIWGETRAQVFSCKFCEMFENTFFIEQLRWLLLCLIFFWSRSTPTVLFALAMPGPCVFYFGLGGASLGALRAVYMRLVWVAVRVYCLGPRPGARFWVVFVLNCVGRSLSGDGVVRWI